MRYILTLRSDDPDTVELDDVLRALLGRRLVTSWTHIDYASRAARVYAVYSTVDGEALLEAIPMDNLISARLRATPDATSGADALARREARETPVETAGGPLAGSSGPSRDDARAPSRHNDELWR